MAYDETLAERIRDCLFEVGGVSERKMFGGVCFMVEGHMACGIVGDDLMLRLGEEGADRALGQPHVRPMDFTGRPMQTMVYVAPAGTATRRELAGWIELALAHVRSLPPKQPRR